MTHRPWATDKHWIVNLKMQEGMAKVSTAWISPVPHWACEDCGQPCSCQGAARFLAHERCGRYEL